MCDYGLGVDTCEPYYKANDFLGGNLDSTNFIGKNLSYYGEYGLGNKLAVFGQLLYQDMEQTDVGGITSTASGFGDAEIGLPP